MLNPQFYLCLITSGQSTLTPAERLQAFVQQMSFSADPVSASMHAQPTMVASALATLNTEVLMLLPSVGHATPSVVIFTDGESVDQQLLTSGLLHPHGMDPAPRRTVVNINNIPQPSASTQSLLFKRLDGYLTRSLQCADALESSTALAADIVDQFPLRKVPLEVEVDTTTTTTTTTPPATAPPTTAPPKCYAQGGDLVFVVDRSQSIETGPDALACDASNKASIRSMMASVVTNAASSVDAGRLRITVVTYHEKARTDANLDKFTGSVSGALAFISALVLDPSPPPSVTLADKAFRKVRLALDGSVSATPVVVVFSDGDSLNLQMVTEELALPFHRATLRMVVSFAKISMPAANFFDAVQPATVMQASCGDAGVATVSAAVSAQVPMVIVPCATDTSTSSTTATKASAFSTTTTTTTTTATTVTTITTTTTTTTQCTLYDNQTALDLAKTVHNFNASLVCSDLIVYCYDDKLAHGYKRFLNVKENCAKTCGFCNAEDVNSGKTNVKFDYELVVGFSNIMPCDSATTDAFATEFQKSLLRNGLKSGEIKSIAGQCSNGGVSLAVVFHEFLSGTYVNGLVAIGEIEFKYVISLACILYLNSFIYVYLVSVESPPHSF